MKRYSKFASLMDKENIYRSSETIESKIADEMDTAMNLTEQHQLKKKMEQETATLRIATDWRRVPKSMKKHIRKCERFYTYREGSRDGK